MVTINDLDARHVRATFRFPGSVWADSVQLAGDLAPCAYPMAYSRDDDEWQLTVILEVNRTYHYWYVLDGSERCFDRQDTFAAPGSAEEDVPAVAVPLLVAAP